MTKTKTQKKNIIGLVLMGLLLLCLFFFQDIYPAMQDGLKLCYTTIIPSLFPFMVLSDLFSSAHFMLPNRKNANLFSRLFHQSPNASFAFLVGMLCGFPLGVREVCRLYREKVISHEQANHLLGFLSCASPSFVIFGIGLGLRDSLKEGIYLYLIQVSLACVIGIATRPKKQGAQPMAEHPSDFAISLPKAVASSVSGILSVCGMICVFSVLTAILSHLLPAGLTDYLAIFLEITGGAERISHSFVQNKALSFALTSAGICFSGFSVHTQAAIFIIDTDLSYTHYLKSKCFASAFGFLLGYALYECGLV